jgi:phosphodiesterase/alkaline phosphatase D-like protein
MVLTVFQVTTTNVSANDPGEIVEINPTTHDHRQLTISNEGAASPASAMSSEGTLHVVWVDMTSSGAELSYKQSIDNGTYFTPDLIISSNFYSITNISISCQNDLDIGIAFEGCLDESSDPTVYLLCSSNGGLSWSQAYQLCEGSSPSVFSRNGCLYLGLTRPYNNSFVFSILNFTIDNNEVVNSASMISLTIGEGFGKITGDASEIYYAVRCSDGITYGSIGYDGQQVDASRYVRNIYSGNVSDLDLHLSDDRLFIVWSLNDDVEAYIFGLISSSDHQSWTAIDVSNAEGGFGSVSVTACSTGFFVAWENDTKAWTEITASQLSSDGTIIIDAMRLSTDRVESACPSVTTDANGEVVGIWVEEHYQTTELFFFQDILFKSLDIRSMAEYIASLDDDIFTSSTARSVLIASIELITGCMDNADDEGAITEIGSLLSKVDGFMGGATGNDLIDSFPVQIRIYDVLLSVRDTLSSSECPTGMAISNLASAGDSNSAVITWTTSSDATSVVEYGIDPSYGSIATGVSGTSHTVTITGLSASTTYYYKARSMSTVNPSYTASSTATFTTDDSLNFIRALGTDSDVIQISSSSVRIRWTTSIESTSVVDYGPTSSYGSTVDGTSGVSHSVTITGLLAGTLYHYRVRSVSLSDPSEMISGTDANFTTNAAEISSVTVTVLSSSSVTIAWATSLTSTSYVDYGNTSSYGSTATGMNGTSHSVTLNGLLAATAYHFRVRSISLTNDTDVDCSADGSLTTGSAEISSVTVTVSSSHVTFSWTTSSYASSIVEYGASSSYDSVMTGSSGVSHSVTISGLYPCTSYHYRVKSVSSSTSYSTDRTFVTGNSAISNIIVTIGSTSTTIVWTTSFKTGTSVVEYGTDSSYGCSATGTTSGYTHTVTMTGLPSSTTYCFRAKSVYSSEIYYSVETVFSTPAIMVADVCLTAVSSSSIVITWATSLSGTSVVDYGTTSSYGNTVTGINGTLHSVTLTGLTATTYHFRVRSVSLTNLSDTGYSNDSIFRPDMMISDITVTLVNSITVTICWATSTDSSSEVEYGITSSYGSSISDGNGTSHSVTLTDLSPSTTYHYRINAISTTDPSVYSSSLDRTFTTNAPEINNIVVTDRTSNSVTITWTTNQLSTSVVDYGTTSSYGNRTTGTSDTHHSVTLTGLSATTIYHFRAMSVLSSITYYSADTTFTTGSPEITNVNVNVHPDSVVISWLSLPGEGTVEYGVTTSYGSTATDYSISGSYSVTITGLPTNATFHFRVKTLHSYQADYSADATFTIAGITISAVSLTNINSNSVKVTWTTSASGTSTVEYGTTSSYDLATTGSIGTSHSITLTGLSPATLYHYRVVSTSATASSDIDYSNDSTFTSMSAEISSVTVTIGLTSATFVWDTGATMTSLVEYGTTSSYGSTATGNDGTHHSVTITNIPSAATYHFRVVSSKLNSDHVTYQYAYSADSMFTISALAISDVVVTPVNSITVTIAWNTSISGTSVIEYGTDSSYGCAVTGTSGNGRYHSVSLTSLSASTTYHYRIVSASLTNSSDIAYSADSTFTTGAAEISHVVVTLLGSNSASITWTTVRSSTSVVEFGLTSSYGSTATGNSNTLAHSVTLTGLSSATVYHFRAKSVTTLYGTYYSEDITFDTPAIAMSSVTAVHISSTSVNIMWTTSISGTSVVEYGTNSSYGSSITGTSGTSHCVALTGLPSDVIYHFRVRSASTTNSSDITCSNDSTFRCGITVSNIAVVPVSSTSVTITWTTSLSGTSVVNYGATSSYGSTATGSSGTSHSVTLTGLTYSTTYHFRVRSTSATNSSDIAFGNDSTFRPGIVVSNVKCTVSTSSATVTWTTSISGSTVVEYGPTSSYGYTKTSWSSGTSHSVTITGLSSATTYHFRVKSVSSTYSSDIGYSNDSTFVTPAITISDIAYGVSGPSAVITWTTSVTGSSVVEYGLTTGYGNTVSDTRNVLSHSLTLSGLASATTYHFMVSSVSSTNSSDTSYGVDATFSTSSITITSLQTTVLSSTSARIVWNTDFAGSTMIEYGRTTSYGTTTIICGNSTYHSITLSGLNYNTRYYYRVTSVSQSNSADSVQHEGYFTTPVVTISNLATVTTNYTASITWSTNIAATTVVEYGTTTSYGLTVTGDNGASHSVSIIDLLPGTTYYYRVKSASTTYGSDVKTLTGSFTTKSVNDAEKGIDAGSNITGALHIVTGSFSGALFSQYDVSDYYKVYANSGQQIQIILTVPSGYNYDLYLLDSSGASMGASNNAAGQTDSIDFIAPSSGYWYIAITWVSGTGSCTYSCSVDVSAGQDIYDLDVGSSGDSIISDHLPGMSIHDVNDLWKDPVGSVRQCGENAAFLLNLYEVSYQAGVGYLITIRYYATAPTAVQALCNGVWVNIAALPAPSSYWSYSFVLSSEYINDALPGEIGCNVELRFDHALKVDTISAVAYSYTTDLSLPIMANHNPGIALMSGWTIENGIANGTDGSTLTVSVPLTTVSYDLTFTYLNASDGMAIDMYTSAGWTSVGALNRWGSSATVTLNYLNYYDSDTTVTGMNLLLRVSGGQFDLTNLTSVAIMPSAAFTDVGVAGDSAFSGLTTKLFGVSVLDDGRWSGITTTDGVSVRTVTSSVAYFYLNAPVSDQSYRIDITYKTSSTSGGIYQLLSSTPSKKLGTLTGDGTWRTLSVWVSPDSFMDGAAGSFINAKFSIGDANGTLVSSFTVNVDSDKDTLTDSQETVNYGTDPFSADTDSDGLNDNEELSSLWDSDPCDADTDSDGLMDGSEIWSQSWSNDEFYNVTYNADALISYSLPALANVTGAMLLIGITSESMSDIAVYIRMDSGSWKTLLYRTASGSTIYASYDLLANRYASSNFASSHTWCIKVNDLNHNDIGGEVQYVTLQVSGTTDPKDPDTDGDGILDGEEVDLGVDGWSTNPVLSDTDGDDLSDYIEINGIYTPCHTETDPTLKDTDGDGYNDSDDLYMGDAVLRVTLLNYSSLASYGVWPNEQEIVDVFFVITYVQGNEELATKQLIDAHKDQMYYLNWKYDIDIPDNATCVSMIFEAVAEDAAESGIGDGKLDIDNGLGTDTYNVDWNISGTPFFGIGTDGGDRGAYLSVKLQVATAEKANVIIINGTGDGGDYGLDEVSPGVYRYSADEQVYLINLNVSSASTHFEQGMNTIILPRAIALECQLNDTLYDLGSMNSSNALYNASFYSTNMSSSTSSSHIVVVITKNVTATQAEAILAMLTFNSTNARIGNNVTISSSAIYLLHLPGDVLSAIPTSVENAGMGEGPSYFSLTGLVTDLAEMAFGFLVWLATGGLLLLLAHLVLLGLEAIANLASSAASAIMEAVDAIVDAFCAFVDWAIEFIKSTIRSSMNGMINGLQQLGNAFCGQMQMSCNAAAIDYNATGAVSQEQISKIATALIGTFFISLLTIGYVIITALIILSIVTNVFSFLVGLVVSTLLTFIVVELFMSTISYLQGDDPLDSLSTFLSSFITSQGGDPDDQYLSAAVDVVISVFDIIAIGVLKVSLPGGYDAFPKALAASICGLVIAIYAGTMTSSFGGLLLGVLGLELSLYGLAESIKGLSKPSLDSNSKIAFGFNIVVSLVGTVKAAWDVWGSVQELRHGN